MWKVNPLGDSREKDKFTQRNDDDSNNNKVFLSPKVKNAKKNLHKFITNQNWSQISSLFQNFSLIWLVFFIRHYIHIFLVCILFFE